MRLAVLALFATTACAHGAVREPGVDDTSAPVRRNKPDLEAARELDQQGVRAFRDGRFSDAIRYFLSAYRLGAPSSELWNVARSRERMDDAETAADSIAQYLTQQDLGPQDRAEAERELQALRARPSVLTVITVPSGAVITVDGKQTAGPTPVSLEIRPGPHTLAVHHDGYATETRP
ncbi:MAG TPA: PEGA domain-containing protein, partial [Polyangiaceae bacterium]|nr:PEGA domain-containing protein [Polyangiaceae bacterium]